MSHLSLDALARRLERLERENHRWKLLGVTSIGLLVVLLLTGAAVTTVPDEVRARRFYAIDSNGLPLAWLMVDSAGMPNIGLKVGRSHLLMNVSSDGAPLLVMRGRDGDGRAGLSFSPDGPVLELAHRNRAIRASVAPDAAMLRLVDQESARGAVLGLRADGSARLELMDQGGSARVGLAIPADGVAAISLRDKGDQPRINLAVGADGFPLVDLYGSDGRQRFHVSEEAAGAALVLASQDQGSLRLVAGEGGPDSASAAGTEAAIASSLVFFDSDGAVVWRVP